MCTFNALGLLAGRVQHGSDYFQKVMEDEELLRAICVQGSGAMQELAGKVLRSSDAPSEYFAARPTDVAEALVRRKDLTVLLISREICCRSVLWSCSPPTLAS